MFAKAVLAKTHFRSLIFASIAILIGGIIAFFYQNPPFQKNLEAACQGSPRKVHFRVKPDFYLNKKFLPLREITEEELSEYAAHHLRYTFQTVQNFEKEKSPKFATIPADAYKISQITYEKAHYPLNLKIWPGMILRIFFDRITNKPDLDMNYMAKALEVGATSVEDEALHITYEAEITMYVCESSEGKFADKLSLPADPLLAFWFVPEEKLETRMHEIYKTDFKANPCATAEFMNDYDPYYYWYYWSLSLPNCHASLPPHSIKEFPLIELKELSVETEAPMDLKFLDAVRGRTLKASVNFTLIDDDSILVPDLFGTVVEEAIPHIIATEKFSMVRDRLEYFQNYDIALQTGLIFAWSMRKISDDFKLEKLTVEEMFIQWRMTGKLKNSQQPYEILVSIGSTVENKPGFHLFYNAIRDGMIDSDIFYFGGHSGVGKNLSENRLRENLSKIKNDNSSHSARQHQLAMIMTCFSAHYFSEKNFPLPPHSNMTRDIIYTASLPSGYDARVLTGAMTQIDRYFETGSALNFARWPKAFKADAFFIHKRQK
jgi:hypothetical protein